MSSNTSSTRNSSTAAPTTASWHPQECHLYPATKATKAAKAIRAGKTTGATTGATTATTATGATTATCHRLPRKASPARVVVGANVVQITTPITTGPGTEEGIMIAATDPHTLTTLTGGIIDLDVSR